MSMTILVDYKKNRGKVDARDHREMREILKAGHEINKMKAYGEDRGKIERIMGPEVKKITESSKEKRIKESAENVRQKVMPYLKQFKA